MEEPSAIKEPVVFPVDFLVEQFPRARRTLRIAVVTALCVAVELYPLKPALAALLGSALRAPPAWAIESVWFIVSVVLVFAAVRITDLALVALSRIRSLRPALAFGWTKWTGRYRAPPLQKQ